MSLRSGTSRWDRLLVHECALRTDRSVRAALIDGEVDHGEFTSKSARACVLSSAGRAAMVDEIARNRTTADKRSDRISQPPGSVL
jgi:hypothetical protein